MWVVVSHPMFWLQQCGCVALVTLAFHEKLSLATRECGSHIGCEETNKLILRTVTFAASTCEIE